MKKKWRFLKIFITLIIFGLLLRFSLQRFNNAPLHYIAINLLETSSPEPVRFIREGNIRDYIFRQNPAGKVGSVDIPTLEKQINSFPSVDSANVYMNLNGKLNVDILQRVPAFRLSRGEQPFYVDIKGEEFPVSPNYSPNVMLISGSAPRSDYPGLLSLVKKIEQDPFSRKYFVGIRKEGQDYYLITNEGNFRVELGNLENLDFKLQGFKEFVTKYLVFQDPMKYKKVSVKFSNQIVTTLNSNFRQDSLNLKKEQPAVAAPKPAALPTPKKPAEKPVAKTAVKSTPPPKPVKKTTPPPAKQTKK